MGFIDKSSSTLCGGLAHPETLLRLGLLLMDLLTMALELVLACKAIVAAEFAINFRAWELGLRVQAVLSSTVSPEVGPSFRYIDTAVFFASEFTLVAEMFLFVFASGRFSFKYKQVLSFFISDSSTEIAVWEAAREKNNRWFFTPCSY